MITVEMLTVVISQMGEQFDSHKIIREVARQNQRAYVKMLYDAGENAPFQAVHAQLGAAIARICLPLGFIHRPIRNENIFGQVSECGFWERQPG